MGAALVWSQRPTKVLSHWYTKHLCLFVDHLYLLHNFSKEQAQVFVPSSGLDRYGGKGIMEQNFVSRKSVVIIVIESSVTAVFQENSCCAQCSSSAAEILPSYPCPSCIYYIFPSSCPLSFTEQAGMRKMLQHQALYAKESLTSSEPSTIRAPVESSHWHYPAITKPCSEHFQSPAWFQCLFSSSATTKTAVSFLV